MFKKTWRQIKIFIILIITLVCLPHSILPNRTDDTGRDDLENYKKLNESEQRLTEYKDTDESLRLKLVQLDIINKSRKKNNASPVKLDILASRVANKMCREAAENKYIGHWNLAGEEPYLRYAFAGGYDHISENAYGVWSSDNYTVSNSLISSMMKSGHEKFMAERAPNDGHKQNIIDKSHNFVGIGYYLAGKQFRYYEEFIDRYLDFENIPQVLNINESRSITVKTDGSFFLYYLIIYHEKFPVPQKVAQLTKTGSYQDFSNEEYKKLLAWELASYRYGNSYNIPLKFTREGLYYIHIYLDNKEIKNPSALNTKGKTEGCGIVIRVEK
jgi:uncharacterized protein YkwD